MGKEEGVGVVEGRKTLIAKGDHCIPQSDPSVAEIFLLPSEPLSWCLRPRKLKILLEYALQTWNVLGLKCQGFVFVFLVRVYMLLCKKFGLGFLEVMTGRDKRGS